MRDMTEGSIPKHMLQFTLPLLLSNVFQQLYNAADTIIVGRYLGREALAAVGCAGAVMNILLFLIAGVSLGASVLIAQYYGAQDYDLVRRETGTAVTAGLLFTLLVMAVSLLFTRPVLQIIRTPDAILPMAGEYLRLIIVGLLFTFLYNILSAALRALGDAKASVWFLIASSLLNVTLDIIFIRDFAMGVMGAALATVLSQAAAALACVIYISAKAPLLRLAGSDLRIDRGLLKQTVQYSGIYAVQQCVLHVGVLMVQGAINTLGIDSIAAYNAVTKIDNFSLLPGDSMASSLSMFVAQNKGANKHDRISSGLKCAILIGLCFCSLLALALPLAAEQVMGLFVDASNTGVIRIGASYLRLMAVLYPVTALCNAFQGFYRGLGNMRITLNATILQIPVRVALAYVLIGYLQLNAIPVATGIGWLCMISYELYEYVKYRKRIQAHPVVSA